MLESVRCQTDFSFVPWWLKNLKKNPENQGKCKEGI